MDKVITHCEQSMNVRLECFKENLRSLVEKVPPGRVLLIFRYALRIAYHI